MSVVFCEIEKERKGKENVYVCMSDIEKEIKRKEDVCVYVCLILRRREKERKTCVWKMEEGKGPLRKGEDDRVEE